MTHLDEEIHNVRDSKVRGNNGMAHVARGQGCHWPGVDGRGRGLGGHGRGRGGRGVDGHGPMGRDAG